VQSEPDHGAEFTLTIPLGENKKAIELDDELPFNFGQL